MKINTDLNMVEILAVAVGSFSIATLANLAANHATEEEKAKKKKAIYYSMGGVVVSMLLIKYFNVKTT